MFGTLQFNHSANAGPTFVERADGAAFSALGNNVLQHTACDQCRQKKLRCTGRKTGCERCKACSTECTYTQLFGSNVRRKERKRTARQNDAAAQSQSPSSEQQSESDIMQSTAAVTNRTSPSASAQGGNIGDENGSNSSVGPLANPLDATLLEDAAMSSNTSGDEFVFFDLDPSTFDHFHWSPYSIPGIPSPRSTQPDTFSILDSRSSTATTATHMISNPINISNSTCAGRCLKVMKSLLEELETRMQDMRPCKADVALSFQKQSCIECTQVVRCKSCYTDPDAMLFLAMICDKLLMLNKKIIWYTREGADLEQQLRVGEYDVDQTEEWGSMLQLLTVVQLRKIKALVDDIEKSPAIEGRHAQLIMLKSVKQQVIVLLGRIREALFKVVDEP
ncbi:Zn(II)2Cys6 transcription factor (Eurofung) [Fusarium globosum]|uniref:Zn(II)2Cys6 transcription factor (Eurofung) n=1 Tax=Fusarium globosum TaxID=78864 RepID=A0A8H5XTM2_9HYPO|nr:Zn(II)2Cys6 transcription factor (Eurofung) [Fusarium globosum]